MKLHLMWAAAFLGVASGQAVTTLSDGHVDIFELHYDSSVVPTEFALHVHDHAGEVHFEPGEVILQVNEASYFTSPVDMVGVLGASAYILPSTQEDGMLYGGISADGPLGVFQNNRFRIQMVSAGSANPGNFALYRFGGGGALQIGLQSLGGSVSVSEVTVPVGGHEHWNWGFSAPGTYTFEFQGFGVKSADLSVFETSRELFTFNVIPEPSSGALVVAGMAALGAARRKRRRHAV